jgi:hypothetical protein
LGSDAPASIPEPIVSPLSQQQPQGPTASSSASLKTLMSSVNLDDDEDDIPSTSKARVPPPVESPSSDTTPRLTQPSVSIVEAAKPFFHVTIGDPHKVGDLTSAHTEYQVYTKVMGVASPHNSLFAKLFSRHHPRLIGIRNLQSPVASVTFCGFIISYTTIIPES